jgi:asparagine synthase (glutamine-hydrolysing)
MCGIAGIYLTRSPERAGLAAPLDDLARRMVRSLRHRGPDDEGVWSCEAEPAARAAFAHTRLAILDLSSAGHQPMLDPSNGNSLAFNGEIYNFRRVRDELGDGGGPWSSDSDSEVILRAYARWGRACLERLRGMFAFAIYDRERRELFVARDRMGIKPLYYYRGEGFLIFASEVRALLSTGLVPRVLDTTSLQHYLAYQTVPAPRTMIEGVRMLPPGTWLTCDEAGSVQERRYWDPLENASAEAKHDTKAESRRRVAELLRESAALHLVSDVPVGAFLSGGIDSTAVAALMREAGHTPRTFSVVFTEEAYDEAPFARKAAAHLGADHTEIFLTEETLLAQLPSALAAMDQPTGDGINTYVVAGAVRSFGMKVALSGLGGDELFGGYPSFARLRRAMPYLRAWRGTPRHVRALANSAIGRFGRGSVAAVKTAMLLNGDGTVATAYPPLRQVLSLAQRNAIVAENVGASAGGFDDPYVELLREAFSHAPGAGVMSQVAYAEARTYMHDLLLRDTDQMSMAHALEVRVPLLDHPLVEYVMGLPDEHKGSNGTPKSLLVESLGGLLPESIVRRPKKGFTLPFDPWMRGALRGFCEERLSPERVAARGVFRPAEVQRLWSTFLAGGREVTWSRLWLLVALEEWLESNGVGVAR